METVTINEEEYERLKKARSSTGNCLNTYPEASRTCFLAGLRKFNLSCDANYFILVDLYVETIKSISRCCAFLSVIVIRNTIELFIYQETQPFAVKFLLPKNLYPSGFPVNHPATDAENCEKAAGFAETEGNAKNLRF